MYSFTHTHVDHMASISLAATLIHVVHMHVHVHNTCYMYMYTLNTPSVLGEERLCTCMYVVDSRLA